MRGDGSLDRSLILLAAVALLATVNGCAPPVRTGELKLIDAERAYEKGDYRTAASAVEQFLSTDPAPADRAAALYMQALIAVRTGRRQDAYTAARSAAELTSDAETRWRSNFVLGTLHFEDGDWRAALRAYESALKNAPLTPPLDVAMFRSGQCLERIGRWSESRARFAEVIRRFPTSSLTEQARRRTSLNASNFAVQCGVFTRRSNADQLVATLRRDRMLPYVHTERRGRADMYVVLLGRFARFEDAQVALRDVARFVNQPVIWP